MKRFFIMLIAIIFLQAAYCVSPSASGTLLFETVTANGINLNSRIYTIVQDPYGFIWLGTDYGLLRYDGYKTIRIQSHNLDNSMLLGTVGIEALALGNDTSLWIGTSQGVINLCLNTWRIKRPQQFHNSRIRAMLFRSDTIIWIGTTQGLYKYNPQSDQSVHFNHVNSSLSQNIIRALYQDQSGNLWVGTADKLNVLYAGKKIFESIDLKGNYKPNIKHNLVLDIQSYVDGNDSILFIGTETGLCLFNRYSTDFKIYTEQNCDLTNEVVKTIFVKNQEEIFFGTDLGFNKLNLRTRNVEKYYHNPFNQYSIINNEIWNIRPDNKGNLWLATSNGISRLNISSELFEFLPVYFRDRGDPVGTRVADVLFDRNSTYWIATANGLLSSMDQPDDNNVYSSIISNSPLSIGNINTISVDSNNRIWIGSVAGMNIWDPVEKRIHIPPMDNGSSSRVASNYISTIIKGYDNFFWIGTWGGGLYRARADEEILDDIEIQYVADLNGHIVTGKDHLWALTGNSLNKFSFNTEKVEVISGINQFAGNTFLSSICYSAEDCLWIGSKNQLLKYDINQNTFEIIQMPIDEDFIVTGIIEDEDGIIWGSSSNTLFRFVPSQAVFNYFPIPDRIPLKKFILSPFRKTADGDILVCGFDGFLKFSPRDFYGYEEAHKILITSVEVNGKPVFPHMEISGQVIIKDIISNCSDLTLSYGNRNIELEYSSFPYGNIEREQYACMLAGYEDTWRVTEPGSNSMEYINLPPGKYTFKVKSLAGDSNNRVSSLNIKIRLPFWASPPLMAIYIILLLFIIGVIVYQYLNRMKYKTQMNLIRMEKEQNELLNSSKIRFYINISHELLTSISLIIDPVKNILSKPGIRDDIRNTLKLIERNAHFLKVYIDQLLNFRKIEIGQEVERLNNKLELISFCSEVIASFKGKALSKGVGLKLKAEIKELIIDSDEEKLYSILQNLISNAINFTPDGGDVLIALKHRSDHEIIIEVKDNGIGIEEEEQQKVFERFYQVSRGNTANRGMGIGLTIVKDFVEILNGSIELNSEVGVGTTISIILPSNNKQTKKLEDEIYVKEYVNTDAIQIARDSSRIKADYVTGLPVVLVVDENNDLYEYIRSTLRNKYHVIWAPNGGEALDIIGESIPTIIVSEIQLPDIDGISFCRQVRKNVKTSRIPIICLTAKTEVENQLKSIEAGVDVFLAKPFEIEVLEANIANLIGRMEKTEEFITRRLLLNAQHVEVDSKEDRLLKDVVEYIHKNMTNSLITARDISHAVGISHSNLYRKIKSITGQSLNEFVRFVRLQKAEQLLSTGKLSVSEVMFQVGFTNHSYFSKCFKKLYKLTPKEYTKR